MEQLNKKTINSAIWYMISSIIAKGITVLLTPIYTRVLTQSEFGQYTNFCSWQNILVLFFSLCLDSTVLRARTDYKTEKEFNTYVYNVTIISLLFPLFIAGIGLIILHNDISIWLNINKKFLNILFVILVAYPLIPIYQAKERAEFKYKNSSLLTLGYASINAIIPIIFIHIFYNKNKLDIIIYTSGLNMVIWGIIIAKLLFRQEHGRIKKDYIKYALVIGIPVLPHALANILLGNSDKVMINRMCGSEYAAIYGVVYTCSLAISLLRNSLNNAWTPWFYQKLLENKFNEIKKVSKIFIDLFSLCSLIVCLIGPEIVYLLGGTSYQNAKTLIPIIMLGCYYDFLNLFFINIEFYEKKTLMISIITVIVTALNIVMNYIGIKLFGYIAAAYATVICNFLIVLFHYVNTRKYKNNKIVNIKHLFKRMIEAVCIVIVCVYIYNYTVIRYVLIIILCLWFIIKCSRECMRRTDNE